MVVAVPLTRETAEMMRASKRRAALAKAAQSTSSSSASTAVSPSSSVGTGTPPLSTSPGRVLRTPPRGRTSGRARPLPTRSAQGAERTDPQQRQTKRRRNDEPPQQATVHRPGNEEDDGPSPPSPPRINSFLSSPTRFNPSFGEELVNMLDGIENMGSMESVSDLVHGIDREAPSNYNNPPLGGSGRSYFMSSERVEAASRAAAAVLSGNTNTSEATTAAAGRLLEATARDILNNGSNGDDSAVISSPSGHSNEMNSHDNSGSLDRPHSPEFFSLDDALLDPRAHLSRSYDLDRNHSFAITPIRPSDSTNRIAHSGTFNPSPNSLDWGPAGMDGFFDEVTGDGGRLSKRQSNDSLNHFGGPIASFGAFGSLSNGSTDHPPLPPDLSNAANPGQQTTSKTTVLTPRNRLSLRRPPQLGLAPQVPADEELGRCPSNGTMEQYNPELYNKLRNSGPPQTANHVAPLVSHDQRGNRLVTIRGSQGHHSEMEVPECATAKTYQFYKFLKDIYPALDGCAYLLPGLRGKRGGVIEESLPEVAECTINVSEFGSFRLGHVPGMARTEKTMLSKSDLAIAKRRVESAICAFGGTVSRRQLQQPLQMSDKFSIFRKRDESPAKIPPRSSTTSSSRGRKRGSGGGSIKRSNSLARRERYERKLRNQYFEHGNRLSWDVQANLSLTLGGASGTFDEDDNGLKRKRSTDQGDKRKNRCKKCGQIKQGHICPYASSLQRSIGVMVYPSANAHVADEPGRVAPALCEMNNFISIKGGSSLEASPDKKKMRSKGATGDVGVSEKVKCSGDVAAEATPLRRKTLFEPVAIPPKTIEEKRSDDEDVRGDKPDTGGEDLLFQPKMEITLDQFRGVTPREPSASRSDYRYPQVPLTFSQRKSTSDALFSLSRGVPGLTEECAQVLTEARRRDQWDIAVAELMAQVICVLRCAPSGDYTLEGLRRYLLALGIAC